MNRAKIEKLFDGKLAEGVEVKDIIDEIMGMNGLDINNAKESVSKTSADEMSKAIEQAKAEALKPYQKGGDKYIDIDSYNNALAELKGYKEKELLTQRQSAYEELVKGANFDERFNKILPKVIDDYKPIFDDANKITNAEAVLDGLKRDYSEFIVKVEEKGFTPAKGDDTRAIEDAFLAGLKE